MKQVNIKKKPPHTQNKTPKAKVGCKSNSKRELNRHKWMHKHVKLLIKSNITFQGTRIRGRTKAKLPERGK